MQFKGEKSGNFKEGGVKMMVKMMTLFMKGPCLVARPENCYHEIVGLSSDHRSHCAEVKI